MAVANALREVLADGEPRRAIELARIVHARNATVRCILARDRRFASAECPRGRRGRFYTLARMPRDRHGTARDEFGGAGATHSPSRLSRDARAFRRERVRQLRLAGYGYKRISVELGISRDSARDYVKRIERQAAAAAAEAA